jgi:hypothetical protein
MHTPPNTTAVSGILGLMGIEGGVRIRDISFPRIANDCLSRDVHRIVPAIRRIPDRNNGKNRADHSSIVNLLRPEGTKTPRKE